MNPTALIAEDEPLLAAHLKSQLERLWPQLIIVASVTHGEAAMQQALQLRPQVLMRSQPQCAMKPASSR